jgi:hypothetical protein
MTVKRKTAVRPTLVSIAAPYAEGLPVSRCAGTRPVEAITARGSSIGPVIGTSARTAAECIQLALNVDDVDRGRVLRQTLRHRAGQDPARLRELRHRGPAAEAGAAGDPGHGGTLNRLGVEVEGVDAVDAEQTRLAELGLASADERGTTCCNAKQDKFWVEGSPHGERWQIYTVLADSATFFGDPADGPACCAGDTSTTTSETTDGAAVEPSLEPAAACC